MNELQMSNANIKMTSIEMVGADHYLLVDTDAAVSGVGNTWPEALHDLANNYPDEFRREEVDDDS